MDSKVEDAFDSSWITEEERLTDLKHNCLPEPLPFVSLEFLYVDKHMELQSVVRDKLYLDDDETVLTQERLMALVQSRRQETPMTQYVLKDTMFFHVPIEPEQLSLFVQGSLPESSFVKYYPILEDIALSPSIFVFHPYTTLVFVYYEEEKPSVRKLKSALKIPGSRRRVTKRVRIRAPRNTRRVMLGSEEEAEDEVETVISEATVSEATTSAATVSEATV